jgi:hypothetical protein
MQPYELGSDKVTHPTPAAKARVRRFPERLAGASPLPATLPTPTEAAAARALLAFAAYLSLDRRLPAAVNWTTLPRRPRLYEAVGQNQT